MLHLALATILTVATSVTAPFVGEWLGSLTYRDVRDRHFVRPTKLSVTTAGGELRFSYTFDDGPHAIVHNVERVSIERSSRTFRVRDGNADDVYQSDDVATLAEHRGGHLVMRGHGVDAGIAVEVRATIDVDRTALVMRRDVRRSGGTFVTRQIYRFTRQLPAAAFLADAAILHHAYQALHPGLYRYATAVAEEAHFARLERALRRAATIPQAYLALSQYTAAIRCGHSYPNFFNQPDALAQALFGGTNRVPFAFVWRDRRMIVTRNFSANSRLAPGTEVLAINGRPARAILERLMTLVRADGANDAKRIDELGVAGRDRLEAFDVYYPLVYGQASTFFDLNVRAFGSAHARTLRVAAQSETQRAASFALRAVDRHGDRTPLWTQHKLADGALYLSMPTWETYTSHWDWQKFLQRTFAGLVADRVSNLVVDLRGNEGGTDLGNAIVAHLIERPMPLDQMRQLVRYRRVPATLAPYLDTWDPAFKDWGRAAVPLNMRFFRLSRSGDDAALGPLAPQAPRYRGRVYVLVDAANSSATFTFVQTVQRHRLATLVGEPTGGNQRGINGGAFFFVRLPNTGIEIDLPVIGTFPATPMPDAGLTPDVVIERTQRDIARGRDPVLQAVLARIRNLRNATRTAAATTR